MATISLEPETSEQVIARMQRELDLVTQQSVVSHRMAMFHKAEWEKAERKRIRAEKALNTWRRKLLGIPKDQRSVTEETLVLWDAEASTEANTRDEYGPVER
jgi:hypothetical protein